MNTENPTPEDRIPNYGLLRDIARHQFNLLQRKISYLEIGVCEGGSALAVLGTEVVQMAVLIDPWGLDYGGFGRGSPAHVIETLGDRYMRMTAILTGDSKAILPLLEGRFDMIYVDGDHSAEGCRSDMQSCLRLMGKGAVMMVDDIDHPLHSYLRKVVIDFAAENNLTFSFYPVHTGMAELRK